LLKLFVYSSMTIDVFRIGQTFKVFSSSSSGY
jgi:hypothetical protein